MTKKFLTSFLTVTFAMASSTTYAVDLIGQTESKQPLNVVAEISGVVQNAQLESGEHVKQGQLIASIKDHDFNLTVAKQSASLELARADLQLKKSVYERYVELRKKNSLSQNDLEIAKADYLSAVATLKLANIELDTAQQDLDDTQITSNIAGYVVTRHTEAGAWVNQGDLLYKIVNIDTLKIRLLASEYDIQALTVGQPIELWAEATPEQTWQATINRIGVEVDPDTQAYPVEIDVPNPDQRLKPGMSIHATTRLTTLAHSK